MGIHLLRPTRPRSGLRRLAVAASIAALPVFGTPSLLAAAPRDLVVVAANNFPVDALTKEDIQLIYLGKKRAIGGTPVSAVDQSDTSPIKRDFLAQIMGVSHGEYRAQLLARRFQEGAVTPKFASNSAEVLAEVWMTTGAVGYVYRSELGSRPGIKVLFAVPTRSP